jgi:hypothetical protein
MNICDSEQAKMFTSREFQKILDDIIIECSKVTNLVHAFIIKAHNCTVGAETGSVFIELKDNDDAMKVRERLKGSCWKG